MMPREEPQTPQAPAPPPPPAPSRDPGQEIRTPREQLASKSDIDRLHGAFTSDIARLEQRLVALESEVRVLKFAVFTFGPLILALLVRLVFFP